MEKEFIDKDVEVLVSIGGCISESGLTPVVYRGKLIDSDKSFIKLAAVNSELAYTQVAIAGARFSKNESNTMIIQKEYVVYIKELN